MEDMARLAVVEQAMGNVDNFGIGLYNLLDMLTYMLNNPEEYEWRNIPRDRLSLHLGTTAFEDYFIYMGFEKINNNFIYPKEKSLDKLRIAQAAIERKLYFCFGVLNRNNYVPKPEQSSIKTGVHFNPKKLKITPTYVLTTKNVLLLKIEALFNKMVLYEDEALQQSAKKLIPLEMLQLKALERIREHQSKIKSAELKAPDLPFDIALLMELMGWFKYKFFAWVDKPKCNRCRGTSKYVHSATHKIGNEICNVEVYQCLLCSHRITFPRYNNPRTLLKTRSGRCGEWANCFTLMCRALGYDTRYVYDTTDHVWCEVYDYDSKTWLHVDPCEAKLNAPLMYSHGWNKTVSYVIAVSRDDLQDVTWRYTTNHKEVLKRRQMCSEAELISAILLLRERRQRQVSEARRRYLAKRTVEELAQLLLERKPSDFESHGRISGSVEWRTQRGEIGATEGFTFEFKTAGNYIIGYFPAADEYKITGNFDPTTVRTWAAGVYAAHNMFRKLEHDWETVYLARERNEKPGLIAWRLHAGPGTIFTSLCVRATTAIYHEATIIWGVRFDGGNWEPAQFGESPVRYERRFKTVQLSAALGGGRGAVAWQHAQLFRLPASSPAAAFHILASLSPDGDGDVANTAPCDLEPNKNGTN